jgi:hypothetical protein
LGDGVFRIKKFISHPVIPKEYFRLLTVPGMLEDPSGMTKKFSEYFPMVLLSTDL